jgi:hypothetical protein
MDSAILITTAGMGKSKNAAKHIGRDTRMQRHAEEPLELESDVRFIVSTRGAIVFSGARPDSTVPNRTNMVRWSIDLRRVSIDDVRNKRAKHRQCCIGTCLRDLAPIPEKVVAEYDDGIPVGEIAVYEREMTSTLAS